MKAVIVAKTHMNRMACVGALELGTNKGIRLLQPNGSNQPGDTDFDVGQTWELEYKPRPEIRPPHVEDVLVYKKHRVGEEPNLCAFLLERVQPWCAKTIFHGFVLAVWGRLRRTGVRGVSIIAEHVWDIAALSNARKEGRLPEAMADAAGPGPMPAPVRKLWHASGGSAGW